MTRHGMLYIHPAKTLWQEITAFALTGIYSAVPDQNQASTYRSRRLNQAVCRPVRSHASCSAGNRAIPLNRPDPKSP
jgi:hypothetical protein